jgi:hypothetical protein
MHDAWYLAEVRELILDHLGRGDLVKLATTCRALSRLVTDRIWQTIPCSSVFLGCLPEDYMSTPIRVEDIERMDRYSAKVRSIHIGSEWDSLSGVPPHILKHRDMVTGDYKDKSDWEDLWDDIARTRAKTSYFLPNLREIRVHNLREAALVPLIGTVKGSNLSYIRIRNVDYSMTNGAVYRFLDSLCDTANLEYLFVRDGQAGLLSSKVIDQSPLRTLRIPPEHTSQGLFREHALMPQILRVSTLTSLTLDLTREWYTPEIQALSEYKYLSKLQKLWLDLSTFIPGSCDHAVCTSRDENGWTCKTDTTSISLTTSCERRPPQQFLELLDTPKLRLLKIKFPIRVRGDNFLDVMRAVRRNCHLQELEELYLGGSGTRQYDRVLTPPHQLQEGLIMLLPLSNLQTLRISAAPNFLGQDIDLSLYANITAGLPQLRHLDLGHENFNHRSYYGTRPIHELIPLPNVAAFCSFLPRLESIRIRTVTSEGLDQYLATAHPEWVSPSVATIRIGDMARRNLARWIPVRDYILVWFPNSDVARCRDLRDDRN